MSWLQQAFQMLISLAIATAFLWFGVAGLHSGVTGTLYRGGGPVHRTAHPWDFWFIEGLQFAAGCSMLLLTLRLVPDLWRSNPARKNAARARRQAAQVRSVEAGEGPDPPWVRFPRAVGAVPEGPLMAYLGDVFLPFWRPLEAEARAAYLRRNPPPDAEWREAMAELDAPE